MTQTTNQSDNDEHFPWLLMRILKCYYTGTSIFNPIRRMEKKSKDGRLLKHCVELWVLTFFLVSIVVHCRLEWAITSAENNDCEKAMLKFGLHAYIAWGLLVDQLNVLLRETVVYPKGGKLDVRVVSRSLYLNLVGTIQIVIYFAILVQYHSDAFCIPKNSPDIRLTSLYFSFVTFTTLGYGDMHPTSWIGQCIVIAELLFFILFVVVRLPMSLLQSAESDAKKERQSENPGD